MATAPGARQGNWVVVSVSDNGVGTAADVQARIFEPFFMTKAMGTGLGHSQIRGFVAQSGGFVTERSAPLMGARVSLHFPALGQCVRRSHPGGIAEPGWSPRFA